jgi:cytochrome c oxidase subunit 2
MLAVALLCAAPDAGADDGANGRDLFTQCATCHGLRGEGNREVRAPALAGLPASYVARQLESFRKRRRGADPTDPYGAQMARAAEKLWDEEVASVAAYVASLEPVAPAPTLRGGKASRGETLYEPCAACHGADAEGNVELAAPPLRGRDDWYVVDQLAAFRAARRGADAVDTAGAAMRAAAAALAEEQDVLDVAAYLATLSAGPVARRRR